MKRKNFPWDLVKALSLFFDVHGLKIDAMFFFSFSASFS